MRIAHRKEEYIEENIIEHDHIFLELIQESLELRKMEEKFYKVFDMNPIPMSINRMDNSLIIDVNDAFIKAIGLKSKEELIGKNTSEIGMGLIKEKDRKFLFGQVRKNGKYENYSFTFKNIRGKRLNGIVSGEIINLNGQDCVLTICQVINKKCLWDIFKTTFLL